MKKKRKTQKTLYVSCPIKIQREMIKKLCATASNGRLFPERAKRAQELLVDLDKRRQVKPRPAKVRQHEYASAGTPLTSSNAKQPFENFWQKIVSIFRKIAASMMKCLTQISSPKITSCAAPTDI